MNAGPGTQPGPFDQGREVARRELVHRRNMVLPEIRNSDKP